ncbi:unnamed protein product, partial [Owenia fusiformis]
WSYRIDHVKSHEHSFCNENQPSLDNGFVKSKCAQFTSGCVATIKCRPCFELKGPKTVTCMGGKWQSMNKSSCQKKNIFCPKLVAPTNAKISSENNSCGSVVFMSCLKGFKPSTKKKLTCKPNGKWTGQTIANCKGKALGKSDIKCPDLDKPLQNVTLRSGRLKDNYVLDKVSFTCRKGYLPKGPMKLTCTNKGKWNHPMPICVPSNISCPDISIQNKSYLIITEGKLENNIFQDTILFQCEQFYKLHGSDRLRCQKSGSWDFAVPSCEERSTCPDIVLPTNVVVRQFSKLTGNKDGDIVKFGCTSGHMPDGPMIMRCLNGMWDSRLPRCLPTEVKCRDLVISDPNLLVVAGRPFNNRIRDNIEFLCKAGFTLMGQKKLYCSERGSWSGIVPTCEVTSNLCPDVLVPENGFVILGQLHNNSEGAKITFGCKEGYAINGNPNITCKEQQVMVVDGNTNRFDTGVVWNQLVPTCLEANLGDCPDIVMPLHGRLSQGKLISNKVGEAVVISCLEQYKRLGARKSECLQDGTWSKQPPACFNYTVACPNIIIPEHSKLVILKGKLVGSMVSEKVVFGCEDGFVLDGIPLLTCDKYVKWDFAIPQCIPSECQVSPSSVPNSVRYGLKNVYVPGDIVTYKCGNCYELIGVADYFCNNKGDWFPPYPPSCRKYSCRLNNMLNIANGRVLSYISEEVTSLECGGWPGLIYSCDDGFVLLGDSTVQCIHGGSWSSSKPLCLKNATCQDVPRIITNGRAIRVQERYIEGDTVQYECNQCYKLKGPMTITCQADQTWDNTVPECVEMVCGDVDALWISVATRKRSSNIYFNVSSTLYKKVKFRCSFDFECMVPVFNSGCGIPSVTPKIIGGDESDPHSWPWAVALKYGDKFQCGGTLIHQNWVITAAHCVRGLYLSDEYNYNVLKNWTVLLGKHDLYELENNTMTVGVSKIVLHEEYEEVTYTNDVALFKLNVTVAYSKTITPICLAFKDFFKDNESKLSLRMNCTAIGWGRTSMFSRASATLRQARLPMFRRNLCNTWYDGQVTQTMFCAGERDGAADTCKGDSGGGYFCSHRGRWILCGVTSWGRGCGIKKSPGVYTKLNFYFTWIMSHLVADTNDNISL